MIPRNSSQRVSQAGSSTSPRFLWILCLVLAAALVAQAQPIVATLSLGAPHVDQPISVAVNPVTNRIYVTNAQTGLFQMVHYVTVIDGATNSIIGIVSDPLAVGQYGVAANPVTNRIYVTNAQSDNVTVIDGTTNSILATLRMGGPSNLAVNSVTNKIYVVTGASTVTVIDGATNSTVAVNVALNIGVLPNSPPLAVNAVTNKIYVVGTSFTTVGGIASVIDGVTNSTVTVPLLETPTAVAVNPVTNKIYVTGTPGGQAIGDVTVIDGATNSIVTTVNAGVAPWAVTVNPATNKIYAINGHSNNVTVIDGATNSTTTVCVGTEPEAVAVNPVTNKIYVTNGNNGLVNASVTVIDGATNSTSAVVESGQAFPVAVAVNQVSDKIYVVNELSASLTVIDGSVPLPPATTVQTSPEGPLFFVDNGIFTYSQQFTWASGTPHTIATTSPQSTASIAGTEYFFTGWSAGPTPSQLSQSIIASAGSACYTANFNTVGLFPNVTIAKTHAGNFSQGQTGAIYTMKVTNSGGTPTRGVVFVTDAVPAGLTPTAISGTGWTCTQPAGPCMRNGALDPGASYPAITLLVNVAGNAPASVTNTARVTGGGGFGINIANDPTIVTAVAGGPNWALKFPQTSPSARTGPAMAYDAARQQVVLFGGRGASGLLSDTWAWDGNTWTSKTPATSPPARAGLAMAFDGARQQVVLFGGFGNSGLLSDTWAWNGSNWIRETPQTSPPARAGFAMAYDAAHQQVVLFGGFGDSGLLSDTWAWNGSNWTRETPQTVPPARAGLAMTYDAARQQTVLFGGLGESGLFSDTWVWDGSNWSKKSAQTSPPARAELAMAYDAGQQTVLFGGFGETGLLSDTWEWDGTTWTEKFPQTSPPARAGHAVADDAEHGQVVLFGGRTSSSDTWVFPAKPVLSPPAISGVSPATGPTTGGTQVTITGSNLDGVTAVTFGGNPATSLTLINSTSLLVNTPAGSPGPIDVTVTAPGGSATLTGGFTYQANSPPTISNVSPPAGPNIGGTVVTITGTNLSEATSVTFGGNPGTLLTIVNSTTLQVTTPAGTPGPVNVTVTITGGLSATLQAGFTYQRAS